MTNSNQYPLESELSLMRGIQTMNIKLFDAVEDYLRTAEEATPEHIRPSLSPTLNVIRVAMLLMADHSETALNLPKNPDGVEVWETRAKEACAKIISGYTIRLQQVRESVVAERLKAK